MKKIKRNILVVVAVVAMICCLFGFAGCFFNSGSSEKTITISIAATADVGKSVELTKDFNFSPSSQGSVEYEFIGENECKAKFTHNNSKTYVTAELPGSVSIKVSYIESGETVVESNTVTIKFVANMITTADELKAISDSGRSYLLGNDIDLSSERNWTPISGFTGILNGGGYSIKNLTLSASSDDSGLFSELKGAVNNLKLENVNITVSGGRSNIGAIAGKNSGTIQNCQVSGTIKGNYATCVGGIAGYSNTNLYNNVNNANIEANEKVGGVVGCIVVNASSEIKDNENNGDISGAKYIGGVVGSVESERPKNSGNSTVTLSDCKNSGKITATGDYAGGIAGQATGMYQHYYYSDYYVYLEIANCENNGEISGKDYVAGLYGYGNYVKSATNCVNTVNIVGGNYVGGFIGYSKNTAVSNMNNAKSITGKGYVGGIAGHAGNMENCKNDGIITSLGTILEDGVNKYCVGGVAGYCTGAVNCENSVDISVESAGRRVGGIAGEIYCSGSIENNINSGNMSASSSTSVGGIVGKAVLNGDRTVQSNENNGNISGETYLGGIAGIIESVRPANPGNNTAIISDCKNSGKVTATGDYVGGIAGQATGMYQHYSYYDYYVYLEISNCENNGEVSGKDYVAGIYGYGEKYVKSVATCVNTVNIIGDNYVGGFIGYSENTATSNMTNNKNITGKGYVGGIAGYAGNVQNCKNEGAITSLGTILEDSANKYCVGGIAGYCTGAMNCENNVDLTLNLEGRRVGGIAGEIYCSNSIENNINTGNINASSTNSVGGIAGKITVNGERNIKGNINSGEVKGASYVGGLAGIIESVRPASPGKLTAAISGCENSGKVTATGDYAGGIAGQATGLYEHHAYSDYYLYIEISNNKNTEAISGNSSGTYAAIVGQAGKYVNTTNSSLWASNTNSSSVGKLYN